MKRDLPSVNAVLRLSAQTAEPCAGRTREVSLFSRSVLKTLQRSDLDVSDKALIEILYLYGLRISEGLRIKPTDILPNGSIAVKTSKTGEMRIITPVMFAEFWQQRGLGSLPLEETRNRWYYYRMFKKMGLYAKYGNNLNRSVTHIFRHELVRQLEKAGIEKKSISQFLAHKSLKSIGYYETDPR